MDLEITGEFTLNGSRQGLWDVLNDPDELARAIPRVDELIVEEPDKYRAKMSVGVGLIRGKFEGNVTVKDKREPEGYRMIVEGKGGVGSVKGDAEITLAESGEHQTVVRVIGDAEVGGMLAKVGERMIRNVAISLMKQFFQNVEKQAASSNRL